MGRTTDCPVFEPAPEGSIEIHTRSRVRDQLCDLPSERTAPRTGGSNDLYRCQGHYAHARSKPCPKRLMRSVPNDQLPAELVGSAAPDLFFFRGARGSQARRGEGISQTVAEALVDLMVDAGIKHVYGIVGDSANPIVDAMRRHSSTIEFVHVRNEEAGAFAAGAEADFGQPTAVLGSSGPGSVHLLNGLYDCKRNGSRCSPSRPIFRAPRSGRTTFRRRRRSRSSRTAALRRHDRVTRADAADRGARDAGGHPRARCRDGDPAR